jgi:hypothetical protein
MNAVSTRLYWLESVASSSMSAASWGWVRIAVRALIGSGKLEDHDKPAHWLLEVKKIC